MNSTGHLSEFALTESLTRSGGSLQNRANDGVVADIRPGMIHVEHSDIESVTLDWRNRVDHSRVLKKIVVLNSFHRGIRMRAECRVPFR